MWVNNNQTKSSNSSDAGTTSRVFANVLQFLNDNNKGVFTIMTANDVSQLPPELTRAGRLDAIWYHSLPKEQERKEIFKIHFRKAGREISEEILDQAAKNSYNYTGAEIEQIVKISLRKAFKKYKDDKTVGREISKEDILNSIEEVIPIYQSSKEKILALENWSKNRARSTNNIIEEDYNYTEDNDLAERLSLEIDD